MLDHLAAITVKHLWLETESLLLLLPAANSVTIVFASFFTPRCQIYLAKIILLGWISSTTSSQMKGLLSLQPFSNVEISVKNYKDMY